MHKRKHNFTVVISHHDTEPKKLARSGSSLSYICRKPKRSSIATVSCSIAQLLPKDKVKTQTVAHLSINTMHMGTVALWACIRFRSGHSCVLIQTIDSLILYLLFSFININCKPQCESIYRKIHIYICAYGICSLF